jgi:sugar lactone lactonase YvrE
MAPGGFANVTESEGGSDGSEDDATAGSIASDGGDAATGDDPGGDASDGAPSGPDVAPAIDTPLRFSEIGSAVKVSGQFYFTEGPVWDPRNDVLYFTDINAHQGGATVGAIYTLTLPSTFAVLLEPDGNADGLGLDPAGNLIAAGYGSRSIWRLSSAGTMTTLSPCSGSQPTCYQGQEVNTPDDIASRSDGTLYFTDPTFGKSLAQGSFPLSGAEGVYRLTNDGVLHLEDASTDGPNGVTLSPDEKTLYVAYTSLDTVARFTVAVDGSLSQKSTFASATLADSMCVDARGDLFVGTAHGLEVFGPAGGAALGTIAVGGDVATNCAFGGADQTTLFITSHSPAAGTPSAGSSSLYEVDGMPVPGIAGRN